MESGKPAESPQRMELAVQSRPGSSGRQSHDHSRPSSRLEISRPTSAAKADVSRPSSRMLAATPTPAPPSISEEQPREATSGKRPELVPAFPSPLPVTDFIEVGFDISPAWRSSYFNPPLPIFIPATTGRKR